VSKPFRLPIWPSDNPEGDWILMDPDERDEWFEWFTRHGIDPNYVTAPGTVVADDLARRISYVAYETDECGQFWMRDGEMARVGRVVQLEARALPLPSPETAPRILQEDT
jgi:hypothetical protein